MTFQEIKTIIETGEEDIFAPFGVPNAEEIGDKLSINDFIALPIIVNNSYDKTTVIEVKLLDNEIIGYIYFSNNGTIITADNMSDQLFAAYLKDVNVIDFQTKERKIIKDYLVVKRDKLADYLSHYYDSSGIWGGYIHEDLETIPQPSSQTITEIYAIPHIQLPTIWHKESMIRAIQQPFAFERFLKNYHLLELLFDWQAMEDISKFHSRENFDKENFDKAASVLRNYKKDDLDRIKSVITARFQDISKIRDKINKIADFPDIAKNMFYKYGKDSNPLKEESSFDEILTKTEFFNESNFTITSNGRTRLTVQPDYNTFIINLASYWIYRIRSSIAHSKIGEYQLSYTDEAFMVEFAEPLLKEVVIQCFTEIPVPETHVEPEQPVNATPTESIEIEPVKKN